MSNHRASKQQQLGLDGPAIALSSLALRTPASLASTSADIDGMHTTLHPSSFCCRLLRARSRRPTAPLVVQGRSIGVPPGLLGWTNRVDSGRRAPPAASSMPQLQLSGFLLLCAGNNAPPFI